jgi:dimethylaniline monooxygenase (N-oxide forming)
VVHLAGGEELQSDAILCGTGWSPSIQFFDEEELVRLGLPHDPNAGSFSTSEKWSKLDAEADNIITTTFPLLADPPPHTHRYSSTTPYRLYYGMLPIADDSILMMNHIQSGNKMLVAEAQAMWAVAYFDGQIKISPVKEMKEKIALWVAFSRRRYLSNGEMGNNVAFESITYADMLLKDMGLSAHSKGWWKDTFEPFWPRDLGRAWAEYSTKSIRTE